jgi:hypothetical protein
MRKPGVKAVRPPKLTPEQVATVLDGPRAQSNEFFGPTYAYPTPDDGVREIGVIEGLGDVWIVAWLTDRGSRRRVKTHHLPPMKDPAKLQASLDAWADRRGLDSVARVAGAEGGDPT